MKPAIRTQVDDKGDLYSSLTSLHFELAEDLTRQEFREEVDVNTILKRFGVNLPNRPGGVYADIDYQVGLQDAMSAIAQARAAHARLPEHVRERYPDYAAVLAAVDRGELTSEQLKPKPSAPPPAPAPQAPAPPAQQ